jgi:hypothetical protein
MLTEGDLKRLISLDANPTLSVYLNVESSGQPISGSPGHRIWLKSALKSLDGMLPSAERKRLAPMADELGTYLQNHRPQGKAWVLFWNEKGLLKEFHLRVPVVNEVQWGQPSLVQLEWLLAEYPPYGVVLVDSERLRFFSVAMNEIREEGERALSVDVGAWRRKELMPRSTPPGGPMRGPVRGGNQREAFEARLNTQIRQFWKEAGEQQLRALKETRGIKGIILAGPKAVQDHFIESLGANKPIEIIGHLPLRRDAPPAEILEKTLPLIQQQEQARQQRLVADLLHRATQSQGAGVGLEPTLQVLQSGRVSQLILADNLDGQLAECIGCHYSFPKGIGQPTCPRCGANSLRGASLRVLLPILARRYGAKLEVVHEQAAEMLAAQGGIGGLWRY